MSRDFDHAMIDIECLDIVNTAKVLSIGVVLFDPIRGKVSDKTFYACLDHKSQTGRTIGKTTKEFWDTQSKEARKCLFGTQDLKASLEDLAFDLPPDVHVWANGPYYDMNILEDAYRWADLECPWKFWNVMDCRTITFIYEALRGGIRHGRAGVRHNALDDAIDQAKLVCKMMHKISK